MEVWKDIPGYEGLYQVSNLGAVKSLPRLVGRGKGYWQGEKIMRVKPEKDGYLSVTLCKDGRHKTYRLHRVVLATFNPVENMECLECGHLDENPENCRLDNLRWMSHVENINWGERNKKAGESISKPVYCIELDKTFDSLTVASKETGAQLAHICSCCRGVRNKAGGYHWRYAK